MAPALAGLALLVLGTQSECVEGYTASIGLTILPERYLQPLRTMSRKTTYKGSSSTLFSWERRVERRQKIDGQD